MQTNKCNKLLWTTNKLVVVNGTVNPDQTAAIPMDADKSRTTIIGPNSLSTHCSPFPIIYSS